MPPKRTASVVRKRSPNKMRKKKKTKQDALPAPISMSTALTTASNNPLEPEQLELALKTFKLLKKDNMVILVGKADEPGCAKTMIAGEVIHLEIQDEARSHTHARRDTHTHPMKHTTTCCAQVANGDSIWVLYVGKDRALTIHHRADINAPKSPAPPFNSRDISKTLVHLATNKWAISCLTREMFVKLFEGDKTDKTPLLHKIIQDSRVPITAMLVVFDEVHQIYTKKKHYAKAMETMRNTYEEIKWSVMGITSTDEFDTCNPQTVMDLFGSDKLPKRTVYRNGSFETLKAKMYSLPQKPCAADFQVLQLPSPIGDKELRQEMNALDASIVDLMLVEPKQKKNAHNVVRDILNTMMAMQMIGTHGGLLIDTICKELGGDRLMYYGGDKIANGKESVLIFCKYDKAARKLMDALQEMIDKGNLAHPLHIVDLGVKLEADQPALRNLACENMMESFNAQDATTLGFASFSQRDGHDNFSKIASSVLLIGFDFTTGDLNQSGARVSRPFVNKPVDGDVVPVDRYLAYHFDSSFAKRINSIDNSRLSCDIDIKRDYPKVQEALDKLMTEAVLSFVEMKGYTNSAKKLLYADSLLEYKNQKLTFTFIDYLYKYYVKKEQQEEHLDGLTDQSEDESDDDEPDEKSEPVGNDGEATGSSDKEAGECDKDDDEDGGEDDEDDEDSDEEDDEDNGNAENSANGGD